MAANPLDFKPLPSEQRCISPRSAATNGSVVGGVANRLIASAIEVNMPAGYAHIIKLPEVQEVASRIRVPQYQFTFHDGQRDYARTFSEPELVLFLTDDLGLTEEVADRVLSELHAKGDTIMSDLHISDNDASFMGLNVVQSEY